MSETIDAGKGKAAARVLPAVAAPALHTVQREVEPLCHERQVATEHGCRGPQALRRWRDDDEDDDGADGRNDVVG